MGCSGGCGGSKASSATKYPKTIDLPDGTKTEVTSAQDEHAKRQQAYVRLRAQQKTKGYSSRRA